MKCVSCGHNDASGTEFCTACGTGYKTSAKSRKTSRRLASKAHVTPPRQGINRKGLIAVAAVVGAAVLFVAGRSDQQAAVPQFGAGLATVVSDDPVRQVAAKFLCACGSCDVPELADCTCPTAKEQRRFIKQALDTGSSPAAVVRDVQRRYGGIKPRYAAPGRTSAGRSGTPGAGQDTASTSAVAALGIAADRAPLRLLTLSDTSAVAARFTCACGQCGELPLIECDCEHRRGAAEIKAFIADKIKQGKTMDELVQAVAYEYGHLIQNEQESGS